MLIQGSPDILSPPDTPGFAGLGAAVSDTFNMSAAQLAQHFAQEFPWFPLAQVQYYLGATTDPAGGAVYDVMQSILENAIRVQVDVNAGNQRSYEASLSNPAAGDPAIWLSAVSSGEAQLQTLQSRLDKVVQFSQQWATAYNDWMLSQWQARQAAQEATWAATQEALTQASATAQAQADAYNAQQALLEQEAQSALTIASQAEGAAQGAALLAQQTSARAAQVSEIQNRRAAGETWIAIAADFIRSLGIGPATDLFLSALPDSDPGYVIGSIIEPANVKVTGVVSRPIVVTQAQPVVVTQTGAAVTVNPQTGETSTLVVDTSSGTAAVVNNTTGEKTPVVVNVNAGTVAEIRAEVMPVSGLEVPSDLNSKTEAQKVQWYRSALAEGYTDASIRLAVEAAFGRQTDADWSYLRAQAAKAPAAGAGLLIAAVAALAYLT